MTQITSYDLKKNASVMDDPSGIFPDAFAFRAHCVVSLFKQRGFHCPCRNKKRFHHQALIEVRILEHLRKKDLEANSQHNVIHMLEYFYFRNHLCISFELMR